MAKELPVGEKLKRLYELQLIDSEIDQIQVLKGELPMEVSDLEDEIAGLQTRIERLKQNIDDLAGEVSRHNANIQEADALILRYKSQMDNVKNNREYDALSKEIEMQELEKQLSSKKIREFQAQQETKQETLNAAEERLGTKSSELETKKVELKEIIAKTEKEEEKLNKKSDKAKKDIEDRLLKAYEKIRSNYRNGLAVVTVERDACGGCFNSIPPQVQLEIGLHKKVLVCEHCGRILVDENVLHFGEEKAEEAAS